jgi:hypothetical protein
MDAGPRPPNPPGNPPYYANQPTSGSNKPTFPVNPPPRPPSFSDNVFPSTAPPPPPATSDVSMNLVQLQLQQQTAIVIGQVGQMLREQKLGVQEQMQITEILQKLQTVQQMTVSQQTLQAQVALLQLVATLVQSVPSTAPVAAPPSTLPGHVVTPPDSDTVNKLNVYNTGMSGTTSSFTPINTADPYLSNPALKKPAVVSPPPPLPRDPFVPEVLRRYSEALFLAN